MYKDIEDVARDTQTSTRDWTTGFWENAAASASTYYAQSPLKAMLTSEKGGRNNQLRKIRREEPGLLNWDSYRYLNPATDEIDTDWDRMVVDINRVKGTDFLTGSQIQDNTREDVLRLEAEQGLLMSEAGALGVTGQFLGPMGVELVNPINYIGLSVLGNVQKLSTIGKIAALGAEGAITAGISEISINDFRDNHDLEYSKGQMLTSIVASGMVGPGLMVTGMGLSKALRKGADFADSADAPSMRRDADQMEQIDGEVNFGEHVDNEYDSTMAVEGDGPKVIEATDERIGNVDDPMVVDQFEAQITIPAEDGTVTIKPNLPPEIRSYADEFQESDMVLKVMENC